MGGLSSKSFSLREFLLSEDRTTVGPITQHEGNGPSVLLLPQADVGLTSSLVMLGELSSKPEILRKKHFIHPVAPSHQDGTQAQVPASHP